MYWLCVKSEDVLKESTIYFLEIYRVLLTHLNISSMSKKNYYEARTEMLQERKLLYVVFSFLAIFGITIQVIQLLGYFHPVVYIFSFFISIAVNIYLEHRHKKQVKDKQSFGNYEYFESLKIFWFIVVLSIFATIQFVSSIGIIAIGVILVLMNVYLIYRHNTIQEFMKRERETYELVAASLRSDSQSLSMIEGRRITQTGQDYYTTIAYQFSNIDRLQPEAINICKVAFEKCMKFLEPNKDALQDVAYDRSRKLPFYKEFESLLSRLYLRPKYFNFVRVYLKNETYYVAEDNHVKQHDVRSLMRKLHASDPTIMARMIAHNFRQYRSYPPYYNDVYNKSLIKYIDTVKESRTFYIASKKYTNINDVIIAGDVNAFNDSLTTENFHKFDTYALQDLCNNHQGLPIQYLKGPGISFNMQEISNEMVAINRIHHMYLEYDIVPEPLYKLMRTLSKTVHNLHVSDPPAGGRWKVNEAFLIQGLHEKLEKIAIECGLSKKRSSTK